MLRVQWLGFGLNSGSTKESGFRLNLRSNSGRRVVGGSGSEKVLVTLGRDQLRVSWQGFDP